MRDLASQTLGEGWRGQLVKCQLVGEITRANVSVRNACWLRREQGWGLLGQLRRLLAVKQRH